MTKRIDHAEEARKHIIWAKGTEGTAERQVDALLAEANAMLALEEQQRIANILKVEEISLRAQWWHPPREVAAALGLEGDEA